MNWQSKPILVAGVSLSIAFWIWESLQKSFVAVGEYAFLAICVVGGCFWLLNSRRKPAIPKLFLPTDKETVTAEIDRVKTIVETIAVEDSNLDISSLTQRVDNLSLALDRDNLNITITGTKKTGKTSIKNVLVAEIDDRSLSWNEVNICSQESNDDLASIAEITSHSDLVLFLCTGDITESELTAIKQLQDAYQPQLLVFNKHDLYQSEEINYLTQNLQQRVKEIIPPENIILAAATPNPIKVVRQETDGSETEYLEIQKPQIDNLVDRLDNIITVEKEKLVWTTTWRQTIELKSEAKDILNRIRRDRSLPIVEQYQWIAAATAFANPIAALDLLATAAINAQMLVDVGNVYQQKLSLENAQSATGSIGKLIVKLGVVEIASQTIAGLLKTNAVTYIAGGTIQGISAAYLTHITGLSSIAYFQEKEFESNADRNLNIDRFGQKLQQVFEQTKRTTFLENLVKQSLVKLLPTTQTSSAN
jgi:uncharacterized protein